MVNQPPEPPRERWAALSSARRKPYRRRPSGATIALLAAGLIIAVAIVFELSRGPEPAPLPKPVQAPSPMPAALTTAQQTPTPSPSPTEVPRATPTPAPPSPTGTAVWWMASPGPTPTQRLGPTPTPRMPECVAIRWDAVQMMSDRPQVLITIQATNGCGRRLDALELWFRIEGFRQGQFVQAARGHLFDPLRAGSRGSVTIGLPGSLTWYDRIVVTVE